MKISVALCTCNGEKYLPDLLTSILEQELSVQEIIISDDHSQDHTVSLVKEWERKFPGLIQVHTSDHNRGTVKNFERALRYCSGDYLFLADQDDSWFPGKTRRMIEYFDQNPSCQVLFSDANLMDEQGVGTGTTLWGTLQFQQLLDKNPAPDLFRHLVLFRNVVTGACMALRREWLTVSLPFPVKEGLLHDEWIGLCAAQYGQLGYIRESLVRYRIHKNQQTREIWGPAAAEKDAFRWRLLEGEVRPDPFAYYRYWVKKSQATLTLQQLGLNQTAALQAEIGTQLRKGLMAWLGTQPFWKRKRILCSLLLKRKPGVKASDLWRA